MTSSNGYYDDSLTLAQGADYLRDLLAEFPFAEKKPFADEDGRPPHHFQSRSLAVQIAAMLSQFAYHLLPARSLRQGFINNSNTERSGKTLLAKVATIPVHGKMAVQSWTRKDEDLRKVIDAEMLRGSSCIVFDNVRGHIQSQVIEAFMTTPTWTGRVLCKSQMFEAENNATLFFTGNDVSAGPDIGNRCLLSNLFVEEADVQERQIKTPINDAWLTRPENRRAILSALWAIVRHWDAAGRPKPSGRIRVGFEDWCNVIAGMVEFAGFGDCLAEPEAGEEKDINTEAEDIVGLVRALIASEEEVLSGGKELRHVENVFQEIVNISHESGLFSWLLDGQEKDGNYMLKHDSVSSFGKMLRKYAPLMGHRRFRIDGRVWAFSCTGKNRQRRYILDLLSLV